MDGIDLSIPPGECFGFLGPNGAGKTSTMRMLSCLAPRDAGEPRGARLDPDERPRELKRMLGVVAQDTTLDLELTVRENLLVFARYFAIPRDEAARRADELLELMALSDRRDDAVDRLSGGMRRRLQIGRALINRPRLILLDEPTTGLDPQARHAVWERLRLLRSAGATLVLTTHYMDEAAQLCDRLVIMDHGRVVLAGAPAALVERGGGARGARGARRAPGPRRGPGGRRRAGPVPRGRRRPADPVRRRRRGACTRASARPGSPRRSGAPGPPGWRTSSCASPGATCATRSSGVGSSGSASRAHASRAQSGGAPKRLARAIPRA